MQKLEKILFPEFSGLQAYMLPIRIGDHSSVPESFKSYIPLIDACNLSKNIHGEIAYLTVRENILKPGETQVAPEIHLDLKGKGFNISGKRRKSYGIYLANNIEKSCRVWSKKINPYKLFNSFNRYTDLQKWLFPNLGDSSKGGEINPDAQKLLGRETILKANVLYHLHEFNPHQALPQITDVQRQLFRLTVGPIMEWDKDNNTPNENIELDSSIIYPKETKSEYYSGGGWGSWW